MKAFSEATRVQMPAMVHLTRIGYSYFGKLSEDMNGAVYDGDTNILLQVFEEQFKKLNPGHEGEYLQVFKDIKKELNDDDLGRGFYNRLKSVSPVKLIDFENVKNNVFHFTAEFTCKNGQDEFRPDITLFVNGLPLCFVEVKRPNNHGGMVAESSRMNRERFPNKKFRRFINITQLMIFSNNMEYDALGGIVPIQGAFYCTGARSLFKGELTVDLQTALGRGAVAVDDRVALFVLTELVHGSITEAHRIQTGLRDLDVPGNGARLVDDDARTFLDATEVVGIVLRGQDQRRTLLRIVILRFNTDGITAGNGSILVLGAIVAISDGVQERLHFFAFCQFFSKLLLSLRVHDGIGIAPGVRRKRTNGREKHQSRHQQAKEMFQGSVHRFPPRVNRGKIPQ